jgi:hypothetical protein
MQPKTAICYTPGTQADIATLFYVVSDTDIYGWYLQAQPVRFSAAYFMIEDFYADRSARLYRSVQDDVHGMWISDRSPNGSEIRCPIPEAVGHELERIQSWFVKEWVFFENDPAADLDSTLYERHGLPVAAVNIRYKRLNRLDRSNAGWSHASPGVDLNIVEFLQKNWY